MTLVAQNFALDPSDPKAAHRRLSAASAVAASIPGFELCDPRDYARLPEVIERIGATLDAVRGQETGQSAPIVHGPAG